MNLQKFEYQKNDLEILRGMAAIAVRSEKYEGYNEATILNIFLTARALGVDPMLALNGGFNIIKGKINMGAHFMAALARRAGHSIKVVEMSDQKCVIIAKRKENEDSLKYEMTMAEAAAAQLTNKQNWRTNPKQMLYCACIRNVFRILFSDIAIPYDADEMNVEETLKQTDDVGLVEIDPILANPLQVEKKKPLIESLEAEKTGIEGLREYLFQEGVPTDRLDEWVDLRCQLKNLSRDEVVKTCLGKEVLPIFKKSFTKWLSTAPQSEVSVAS